MERTVLALLLVTATACTSLGATERDPGGAKPGSDRGTLVGGTLRVGVCCLTAYQLRRQTFLDPQLPFSEASSQRELLRCCLTRTLLSYTGRSTADGGTVLHPDLATGLPQVSDDGLTWTFRLRRGIRYAPPLADVEITAPDIVRALERAVTPSIGTEEYIRIFAPIQGVSGFAEGEASTISGLETPDPYTLRVHLVAITNDLGYRFGLPATAPIPPKPGDPSARFGTAHGHDRRYGRFLISSGPYMIEGSPDLDPSVPADEQDPVTGLVPGRSLTLVRNPSWSERIDDLRKAYVDRVEIEVVGVEEAARRIEAGSLDLLLDGQPSPERLERYEADPELSDRVFRERCNYVAFASMRLTQPPFDDVHVRRAANLAFDADAYARLASTYRWGPLGYFLSVPITHLAPDSTQSGLLEDWDPYPYSQTDARTEMARSSYDLDGDGRCDDPSCRAVLTLDTNLGPEPQLERVWRDGFRAIGIDLRIERVSIARLVREMADPSSPFALTLAQDWEAQYPSPEPLFSSAFGATGLGASSTPNFSLCGATDGQLEAWGYPQATVPSVDPMIEACARRFGPAQQQCWAQLDQSLMLEVVPSIPINGVVEVRIVSDRVTRYSADQPFGAFPALDQIAVAADTG